MLPEFDIYVPREVTAAARVSSNHFGPVEYQQVVAGRHVGQISPRYNSNPPRVQAVLDFRVADRPWILFKGVGVDRIPMPQDSVVRQSLLIVRIRITVSR